MTHATPCCVQQGEGGQDLDSHRGGRGVRQPCVAPPEVGVACEPLERKGEGGGKAGGSEGVGLGEAGCVRGGVRAGVGGEISSAAEHHRAADRGKGATGAGQSRPGSPRRSQGRGAVVSDGARTMLGGDESHRAPSTGANPGGGGGSATPSPCSRTGPGRAPPE